MQVEQFAGREDHPDQSGRSKDHREHQDAAVVGKAIDEKEQDEQGEGGQVRLVQEKPCAVRKVRNESIHGFDRKRKMVVWQ